MLRTTLASSKYIVVVAILGIYVAAVALILYEIAVVGSAIVDTLRIASVSP
jgi:hypothetical protein